MAYKKIKPNMQKAVDSEIERQRKELSDEAPKARGTYEEAPGGGTPVKGGGRGAMKKNFEVVDSKEEAEAIRKSDPDAVIRYNQPRDENGQFTYNSANNKTISTETSRGHTLPPFLKGVDLTFIKKGSEFKYEDIDEEGQKRIVNVISTIDMTAEELKASCKKYLETEGGFAAIVGTAITKGGRKTSASKTIDEGKVGDLDLSSLSESTKEKIEKFSKLKDKEWLKKQIESVLKPKTDFSSTTKTSKTLVGAGAPVVSNESTTPTKTTVVKEEKPKLSNETVSQVKNALSSFPELADITEQDIIEMYADGDLTDEDLTELGIKM